MNSRVKTLLWSFFSASLGVTALMLPTFFGAMVSGKNFSEKTAWAIPILVILIFIPGLYMGIYRLYTLLLDLGLEQHKKILAIICALIFLLGAGIVGFYTTIMAVWIYG